MHKSELKLALDLIEQAEKEYPLANDYEYQLGLKRVRVSFYYSDPEDDSEVF